MFEIIVEDLIYRNSFTLSSKQKTAAGIYNPDRGFD